MMLQFNKIKEKERVLSLSQMRKELELRRQKKLMKINKTERKVNKEVRNKGAKKDAVIHLP